MLHLLHYLLFLLGYAAWLVASGWTMKKLQSGIHSGHSFWPTELFLLEGLAGFFAFIYLLSGLWSTRLVLLLVVIAHLGVLISWAANAALGTQSHETEMRSFWAGQEFVLQYPISTGLLMALTGLAAVVYPVLGGVFFFRLPWASPDLQIQIVRYTLLLLNLGGYIFVLVINAGALASENLDFDTRERLFVNQMLGLIPMTVYLALAIWSFGLAGTPLHLNQLGIPSGTFSLQTFLFLFALFVVAMLLPYLAGSQRARRRKDKLQESVHDLFSELEDILGTPSAALYEQKLAGFHTKIEALRDTFTSGDAFLRQEKKFRENPDAVPEAQKSLVDAVHTSRDLDPRFRFLDRLDKLSGDVQDTAADLKDRTVPASAEEAAQRWSAKYKRERENLEKAAADASSGKPPLMIAIGAVVSTLVSVIVTKAADAVPHLFHLR